jgi:hypothetical protein
MTTASRIAGLCLDGIHNQAVIYINSFRWRLGIIRPVFAKLHIPH